MKKYFPLALVLTSCSAEVPFGEDIGNLLNPALEIGPVKTPPEKCYKKGIPAYEQSMKEYQEEFDLSEEWLEWMVDNYNRYCRAFNVGNFYQEEYQNKIFLSLQYYNNTPVPYTGSYPKEEHEQDIERLLELTFPGYDIIAKFGRNPENSHGVVYLNAPQISHADRKEIYLHYEAIISHEFGHFLGLIHHYDSEQEIGLGMNMPPGEEKCIMDLSSQEYGSADRAALTIDLDVNNAEEISALIKKINSKYPEDY